MTPAAVKHVVYLFSHHSSCLIKINARSNRQRSEFDLLKAGQDLSCSQKVQPKMIPVATGKQTKNGRAAKFYIIYGI